ncbi:hypothetical protein FOZ62_014014, partial [Perkinsus olseni]
LYESEDSDSEAGDSDEPKVVEVLTSGRGGPSGETTPAEEHLQAPIRNQGDRSVKIGLEFTKRRQVNPLSPRWTVECPHRSEYLLVIDQDGRLRGPEQMAPALWEFRNARERLTRRRTLQ